jgi:hypothetical protein
MERAGIDLDHARGDHGAEPFPHVSLVELRAAGDLFRRRRRHHAERVEETGPVADRHHEAEGPMVEGLEHAAGEGLARAVSKSGGDATVFTVFTSAMDYLRFGPTIEDGVSAWPCGARR